MAENSVSPCLLEPREQDTIATTALNRAPARSRRWRTPCGGNSRLEVRGRSPPLLPSGSCYGTHGVHYDYKHGHTQSARGVNNPRATGPNPRRHGCLSDMRTKLPQQEECEESDAKVLLDLNPQAIELNMRADPVATSKDDVLIAPDSCLRAEFRVTEEV